MEILSAKTEITAKEKETVVVSSIYFWPLVENSLDLSSVLVIQDYQTVTQDGFIVGFVGGYLPEHYCPVELLW